MIRTLLKRHVLLVLVGVLTIPVWLVASGAGADGVDAVASLRNTRGQTVGVMFFTSLRDGSVKAQVRASGLPSGFHGFHIHAVGICDPASVDPATRRITPFFTAGDHYDPAGRKHGRHSGDLPSLLIAADGSGFAAFRSDRFRLNQLFDADGSAVIIHAEPDNFAHIPTRYRHPADKTGTTGPDATTLRTGDSGARIACGVVRRK
jgi:superoxide dismutase, Cu-Zn family